jgi:hypothetical protein
VAKYSGVLKDRFWLGHESDRHTSFNRDETLKHRRSTEARAPDKKQAAREEKMKPWSFYEKQEFVLKESERMACMRALLEDTECQEERERVERDQEKKGMSHGAHGKAETMSTSSQSGKSRKSAKSYACSGSSSSSSSAKKKPYACQPKSVDLSRDTAGSAAKSQVQETEQARVNTVQEEPVVKRTRGVKTRAGVLVRRKKEARAEAERVRKEIENQAREVEDPKKQVVRPEQESGDNPDDGLSELQRFFKNDRRFDWCTGKVKEEKVEVAKPKESETQVAQAKETATEKEPEPKPVRYLTVWEYMAEQERMKEAKRKRLRADFRRRVTAHVNAQADASVTHGATRKNPKKQEPAKESGSSQPSGGKPQGDGGTQGSKLSTTSAGTGTGAGGDGGDGGKEKGQVGQLIAGATPLLRRLTGSEVFWAGRAFPETYELNTYLRRRAEAFDDIEVANRIPPEYRDQVIEQYNRAYGEGFEAMRAGPFGHPQRYTEEYDSDRMHMDLALLQRATGVPGTRDYRMYMAIERQARGAENIFLELGLRQPIEEGIRQEVSEAYDRWFAKDPKTGGSETRSQSTTTTVRTAGAHATVEQEKGYLWMSYLELTHYETTVELGPMQARDWNTPEVNRATVGQICFAVLNGFVTDEESEKVLGDTMMQKGHRAFQTLFDGAGKDEIRRYLFDGGPMPEYTKYVLGRLDTDEATKQDMALLSTRVEGKVVMVSGKEIQETYGTAMWSFYKEETADPDIGVDAVAAKDAFIRMLDICPMTRLWEWLFRGRDLPTVGEIKTIDNRLLSTETGQETEYGERLVNETYGMILSQHRWYIEPRCKGDVPQEDWDAVSRAFARSTRDMTKAQAEEWIYKTLPKEAAKLAGGNPSSGSSHGSKPDEDMSDEAGQKGDGEEHGLGKTGDGDIDMERKDPTQVEARTPGVDAMEGVEEEVSAGGEAMETGSAKPSVEPMEQGDGKDIEIVGQTSSKEATHLKDLIGGLQEVMDIEKTEEQRIRMAKEAGKAKVVEKEQEETPVAPSPPRRPREVRVPLGSKGIPASTETTRRDTGQRLFGEDYPRCYECGRQHARGDCRISRFATGYGQRRTGPMPTPRGFAQSMAVSGLGMPRQERKPSSFGSSKPVEPPKLPGSEYHPPTKRSVSSVKRKKHEKVHTEKSTNAPNGVDVNSYLAGRRVVFPEVTRHIGDLIVTGEPPIYTTVLACEGYGIGWLDMEDNKALPPDHGYPLLMQFGDRMTKVPFIFFNGEKRMVFAYRRLIKANGQAEPVQAATTPIADCIDPRTGRLRANAVSVQSKVHKEAPSRIQKRVCLVHSFEVTAADKELTSWSMGVCAMDGQGGVPVHVRNGFISRLSAEGGYRQGQWAMMDGFKVVKGYPRYQLGGGLFARQVPGSVEARIGFYVVRVFPCECEQRLRNIEAWWTTDDKRQFYAVHREMTEACAAVVHWNGVLTEEKAELGKMEITGTHFENSGLYRFEVSVEGKEGDALVGACSIHGAVKVTESLDDGTEHLIMNGIVAKTEFENDVIKTVWIKHLVKVDEGRMKDMQDRYDEQRPGTIENTAELTESCDRIQSIAADVQLSDKFYRAKVKGRKLVIKKTHLAFVDEAYMHMAANLTRCTIGSDSPKTRIASVMNGFTLRKDQEVTDEGIAKELQARRYMGMDTRSDLLRFQQRMLRNISRSDLDDEQKHAAKLIAVDYVPCINVIAPGGTGKTQMGVNVIAMLLDRFKATEYGKCRIVVVTPNNAAAASFAIRLRELVGKGVIGHLGALMVQSPMQLMDSTRKLPFSMVDRAKHIRKENKGSQKAQEIMDAFIKIAEKKTQVQFNMGTVLELLLLFDSPLVIIATQDMLALYPVLWAFVKVVVLEETSMMHDIKARSWLSRLEHIEQVILLGDPAQQIPYVEHAEIKRMSKFGMMPLNEVVMKRGNSWEQVLVNNRRSNSTLVHCLKQLTPLYASMVSLVEEPKWKEDARVCVPPLVQEECPIILLNVDTTHRITRAAVLSNAEQDGLAVELVKVLDDLNKIDGTGPNDLLIATNYNGQKHAIEKALEGVKFMPDGGVVTVDGAQAKEADRLIWVTGRAAPPKPGAEEFAKDPRRSTVALGRPRMIVYVIGRFDYLTLEEGSPLFNYIREANKRTPVVDAKWYIEGIKAFRNRVKELDKAEEEAIYPDVYTFGPGVLQYDFMEGTQPKKQDHIIDCRINIANGWKNRGRFEPPEELPAGYTPPAPIPFNAPLTGTEVVVRGMAALGG